MQRVLATGFLVLLLAVSGAVHRLMSDSPLEDLVPARQVTSHGGDVDSWGGGLGRPAASPETRGVRVGAASPAWSSAERVPEVGIVYNGRGLWLTDTASGRPERVDRGPVARQSALIPILMYHHVRPIDHKTANRYASELTLPPSEFEQQIRYLQGRGVVAVSMEDLVLYLQGRTDLTSRSVVLTFDDGYADNYQHVLPLLRRYGFRGTFFVTTGFIGQGDYMTWSNLREMVAAGMEIGGHTMSHVDLAKSPAAVRERELVEPKRLLQSNLGVAVRALSYPSGAHNKETMEAAKRAGYASAVTTQHGAVHDRGKMMELARVRISGYDTLPSFRWKIEQYFPVKGADGL